MSETRASAIALANTKYGWVPSERRYCDSLHSDVCLVTHQLVVRADHREERAP